MTQLKQARHFTATLPQEAAPELKAATHFDQVLDETLSNDEPVIKQKSGRWWWRLATVTLFGIVALSVWQWSQFVMQSWQQNSVTGVMLTALSVSLVVLLGALIGREVLLWRRLARNRRWQQSAERIGNSVQYGEATALCGAIWQSLPQTEQNQQLFASWQRAVKAEHSDEEQLQLFNHLALSKLDEQAQNKIIRAAADTSIAVAICPFALADMLLVLWRSSRLLRELAQLYGGSIGQLRSLLMLKRVFSALLWAGGSELALDMTADMLGSELTMRLSARAGQGVIAGILVARIGTLAQQQLRPLPLADSKKVRITALAGALAKRISDKVQRKADNNDVN